MTLADVSVVIPVYNGERWVADAIDSVLAQTQPPRECIVVDDGSTDGTPEVLRRYGSRITLHRLANAGVAHARNTGSRRAVAKWIGFLDADDVWLPRRLERQLDALGGSAAAVAYCGLTVTDEQLRARYRMGVPAASDALRNTLLLEPPPVSVAQAALVDRDAFWRVGGFDETLSTSADMDLFIRLAARFPVLGLNEDLVLYRQHRGQMSSDLAAMEHDVTRVYSKAFASHLPSDLPQLSGRAHANLFATLAAESLRRGLHRSASSYAVRAVRADPSRAAELFVRRIQRLARAHA